MVKLIEFNFHLGNATFSLVVHNERQKNPFLPKTNKFIDSQQLAIIKLVKLFQSVQQYPRLDAVQSLERSLKHGRTYVRLCVCVASSLQAWRRASKKMRGLIKAQKQMVSLRRSNGFTTPRVSLSYSTQLAARSRRVIEGIVRFADNSYGDRNARPAALFHPINYLFNRIVDIA